MTMLEAQTKWRYTCISKHSDGHADPSTNTPAGPSTTSDVLSATELAPAIAYVPTSSIFTANGYHYGHNVKLEAACLAVCEAGISSPSLYWLSSVFSPSLSTRRILPISGHAILSAGSSHEDRMISAMAELQMQVSALTMDQIWWLYWWVNGHIFHTPYVCILS
jgi:hypothetical protein